MNTMLQGGTSDAFRGRVFGAVMAASALARVAGLAAAGLLADGIGTVPVLSGGAVLWVVLFVGGGYWFGNIPLVKKNFTLVILAIIAVSLLPGIISFLREKMKTRAAAQQKV